MASQDVEFCVNCSGNGLGEDGKGARFYQWGSVRHMCDKHPPLGYHKFLGPVVHEVPSKKQQVVAVATESKRLSGVKSPDPARARRLYLWLFKVQHNAAIVALKNAAHNFEWASGGYLKHVDPKDKDAAQKLLEATFAAELAALAEEQPGSPALARLPAALDSKRQAARQALDDLATAAGFTLAEALSST